jgi:hypothetical protein
MDLPSSPTVVANFFLTDTCVECPFPGAATIEGPAKVVTDSDNLSGSTPATDPGTTSSSLLRGLKADEPGAWRRLSKLYVPLVYYWCLCAGLQREDAADVSQEVFRTVAGRIHGFQASKKADSFRAWLRAITRNKVGDFYRSCQAQPRAAGGTDAYERLGQIPAHEVVRADFTFREI